MLHRFHILYISQLKSLKLHRFHILYISNSCKHLGVNPIALRGPKTCGYNSSGIIRIHHKCEGGIENSCTPDRDFQCFYSCETKSILHMYCCGTRKSHPRTRIIRQKRGFAEFLTNYSGPMVRFPCPSTIDHDG